MTDTPAGIDYRETVFLPKTDFPMKAGLPEREPTLLEALGGHGTSTASCASRAGAAPNSCCMMARPTPTATSTSAMR